MASKFITAWNRLWNKTTVTTVLLIVTLTVVCDPHPLSGVNESNNHLLANNSYPAFYDQLLNNSQSMIQDNEKMTLSTVSPFPSKSQASTLIAFSQTIVPSSSSSITTANTTLSPENGNKPENPELPLESDTEKEFAPSQEDLYLERGKPSSLLELETENNVGEDETPPELFMKLDRFYTPKEIADYIFTTGDEKGITQAIADMVEDGQISTGTDDVIHFLEVVQEELGKMRREVRAPEYKPEKMRFRQQRPLSPEVLT